MTEGIGTWVLGLAGAAILTSAAMTITPEGRAKKAVSLVCGVAVMIMLIKPAVGFDYTAYSKGIARQGDENAWITREIEQTNEKLTGVIIERACAAYILDKGQRLGINDLTAAVSVKWSDEGYWYPSSARIGTDADQEQRDKMSYIITTELGIPPEELIWSMNDGE